MTRKFRPQKSQEQDLLDRLPETSGLTGTRANNARKEKAFARYVEMIRDGLVPVTNQLELGLLLAGGVVLSMGPPMDGFMGVRLDSGSPEEIEWAPAWAMAVVKLSMMGVDKTPVALGSFLDAQGRRQQFDEPIIMQHATEDSRRGYVQRRMPKLLHDPQGQLTVCGHALLTVKPVGDLREALLACMAKLRRLEALRKNEADRA